jgi:tetratricopeptide (TPR) repeat protein
MESIVDESASANQETTVARVIAAVSDLQAGLRVAAIPSLSVLAGFIVYWSVPQAQDLFLEVIGIPWTGPWYWPGRPLIEYWALFYSIALLAWALPVYLSARWIIARYNAWARTTMSDCLFPVATGIERNLPPTLASLCFAAIMVGQWQSTSNAVAYHCVIEFQQSQVSQGADGSEPPTPWAVLSSGSESGAERIGINTYVALQSDCDRYAAERNFLEGVRHTESQGQWVRSASAGDPVIEFGRSLLKSGGMLVCAVLFVLLGYIRRQTRSWGAFVRSVILGLQCLSFIGFGFIAYVLFAERYVQEEFSVDVMTILPLISLAATLLIWKGFRRHNERPSPMSEGLMSFGHGVILFVAVAALCAMLLVPPLVVAKLIPFRTSLLTAALGIWVMPLTVVTAGSFRSRLPLIVGALVVLIVVNWIAGDQLLIRRLPTNANKPRPTLEASIERWKDVNKCDAAIRSCPAPIIILAAGGASRSAFFVASVLGQLMDENNDAVAENPSKRTGADFANQLFAISSVSGGSLAAVMFEAALEDSLRMRPQQEGGASAGLQPPCRNTVSAEEDTLWFGTYVKPRAPSIERSWKSCLQMLTSGDFLSPAFIRLIGWDMLGFWFPFGDRATALEESWERRYELMTRNDTLTRSIVDVRQDALNEGHWLPILLLNSTSVTTGRRIIITNFDDLLPNDGKSCLGRLPTEAQCGRVFKDSYDLYELFKSRPTGKALPSRTGSRDDVSLSTAAATTARFPVFSPHATIRNAEGRVADRAVDGGYFENYGAVSAQELAEALRAHQLSPLIVLVTNEPTTPRMSCVDNDQGSMEPVDYPAASRGSVMEPISSPAQALLNTENARGTLDAVNLCNLMKVRSKAESEQDFYGDFLHIRVAASIRELSMSWWLSKNVQRVLDTELAEGDNQLALSKIADAIQVNPRQMDVANAGANDYRQGKVDEAVQAFSEAIALDDHQKDYYVQRASAYRRQGKYDLAIEDLTSAIKLDPKNGRYYVFRAESYHMKGEYRRAFDDYDKAIDLDPDNADYHIARAWGYFKAGRAAEGLADAERSVELRRSNAYMLDIHAHILETMGRRQEAIADYKQAFNLNPLLIDSKAAVARLEESPRRLP